MLRVGQEISAPGFVDLACSTLTGSWSGPLCVDLPLCLATATVGSRRHTGVAMPCSFEALLP